MKKLLKGHNFAHTQTNKQTNEQTHTRTGATLYALPPLTWRGHKKPKWQ